MGSNPSLLTAAATDIALFSEISPRLIATTSQIQTTTVGDTLELVGTFTATANTTVGEAGITDTYTVPPVGFLQPSSTVIASISGDQVVSNTPLSPGNGGYIQIRGEVMLVTAGSGTTTLTVTRGQAGTSPLGTLAINDPIAQGNPPGSTAVQGGYLYAKADFGGISYTLTPGDTIVFTWTLVNS